MLVAEIAGDRKEFGLTLAKYVKQAHATRDPNVVERATRIAVMLKATKQSLDLSTLWLEIEPENNDHYPTQKNLLQIEIGHSRSVDLSYEIKTMDNLSVKTSTNNN